jgi:DNA-binding IclR family transcriptional regulator
MADTTFTPPACYFALESPTQKIIRNIALINHSGRGATQAELASATGYSQQTISRLVTIQIRAGTLRGYQTGAWFLLWIAR